MADSSNVPINVINEITLFNDSSVVKLVAN